MDIEEVRARVRAPRRGRRKVFVPPEIEDFRHGSVLSFDQTLTKTGWSLVTVGDAGIHVPFAGMLIPDVGDAKSFAQTFQKAVKIRRQMEEVVGMMGLGVEMIVHEMPAVMGYRTESSLCSATVLWTVIDDYYQAKAISIAHPAIISRQRAYSHLVGKPSTEKKYGTETVNRLIPKERRINAARWNQDVHDSVLLGLEWLWKGERETA